MLTDGTLERAQSEAKGTCFAYVGIAEAHAADEWPVGDLRGICQSQTTCERLDRARGIAPLFARAFVEPIEDQSFSRLFAPWPTMAYRFEGAVLRAVSAVDGGKFDRAFLALAGVS